MDQPAAAPSSLSKDDYRRLATELFNELFEDHALCPVCFARKRTFYPEYDLDLANRLYRGAGAKGSNKLTFEAMGHSLNEDGSLQVNSATSDADPATYQDVVPETWLPIKDDAGHIIDWDWKPPRSRTICQCGVIDYDFDDARSTGQLYDAVENIGDHLKERYPEYWFHTEAAKKVVEKAVPKKELAGRDRDVLIRAMQLGLQRGRDAPDFDESAVDDEDE